jgi:nucleotidyltransferase/DNA polymerase involved in DNA repair
MFGVSSFPKAILHVDGDAFFASCEQSRHPELKGKPVITGKERGIASSMSYEAKARGVTRAMPLFEIRRICPDAVILPSDYETYSLLSRRLYAIVRRYTHAVEEYGIDECFADLTGYGNHRGSGYVKLAEQIKHDLDTELGFTFSVGLAPSKVLAKVGSKWKKPSGLTAISTRDRWRFLDKLAVDKVWGIGPATSAYLTRRNIFTAGDFARANEWWIKNNLTRPFWEIWQELNGASVMPLHLEEKSTYFSIQKFKTFTPPSTDSNFIFSQLSKNIENACIKARRHKLIAGTVAVILRTQDFRHFGAEFKLSRPSAMPQEIVSSVRDVFASLLRSGVEYRATGIVLADLNPAVIQPDLFTSGAQMQKMVKLYESVDELAAKYGKHAVFLGSSFAAQQFGAHLGDRGDTPERQNNRLIGETKRRRIGIPMLFAEV